MAVVDLELAACWASSGYNVAGCQALETQLRTCMDAPVRFSPSPAFQNMEGYEDKWPTNMIRNVESRSTEEEHDQLPSFPDVS